MSSGASSPSPSRGRRPGSRRVPHRRPTPRRARCGCALSRDAPAKDRRPRPACPMCPPGGGRAVAAQLPALVPKPGPGGPVDPAGPRGGRGVRRQFFNRATVTLMSASLAGFGVAVVAFLWPAPGGFGSRVNAGRLERRHQQHPRQRRLPLHRRGPPGSPSTRPMLSPVRRGRRIPPRSCSRDGGRRRRALPEVPAPGLPSARVQELAVVRVPVPRLAVQPGRREEGGSGAAWHGPVRHADHPGGDLIIDTGTIFNGMPIGTNTTGQEAEGPHCTGGGDH
jgi:cytochrome b6-f complex iron-sulfur subunit